VTKRSAALVRRRNVRNVSSYAIAAACSSLGSMSRDAPGRLVKPQLEPFGKVEEVGGKMFFQMIVGGPNLANSWFRFHRD
jgi:hypothetical protein